MKKLKLKILILFILFNTLSVYTLHAQLGYSYLVPYTEATATNSSVPIYGLWMDVKQGSQFVITADKLTSLVGEPINALEFYGTANRSWPSAVDVSIGVTTVNNMSAGWVPDALNWVYTGTLSTDADGKMQVVFSSPFNYTGGNLAIQFDVPTEGGNWTSCTFQGYDVTSGSRYMYNTGYGGTGTLANFVPKLTIFYGTQPICEQVTNLTNTVVDYNVILTWDAPTATGYTYNVYKNDELLTNTSETTYSDNYVENGTYNYCIEAVESSCTPDEKVCTEATVFYCSPISNLTADVSYQNVTLNWEAPASKKSRAVILQEDFETVPYGGLLPDWTIIDADGDGRNWYGLYNAGTPQVIPGHSGVGLMTSASYDASGSLNPDNYLVTPLLDNATEVTYWVSAQDPEWPQEHYALCASTTGNNASDFTIIFEETLTAKSSTTPNGQYINVVQGAIDQVARESGTRAQGTWYQRTVSLPAGTKYVAWRHYNCTDWFRLNLDDVTIKNAVPDYTYSITRDGVEIASGLSENTFNEVDVPAGDHEYCVTAVYDWGCTSEAVCIDVTTEEFPCLPVTNLNAVVDANHVALTWTPPATGGKSRAVLLQEDFETVITNGIPTDWTVIDADGDGRNWYGLYNAGTPQVIPGHSGVGLMTSASWVGSAINPDNYLVTPLLDNATEVTYWVCAQDPEWPQEHYALCASTTGNNASDFTIVFEETLIAKGSTTPNGQYINVVQGAIDQVAKESGTKAQGTWYQRTVSLPEGTKYVAWRHFNCSDLFRLNLDDVTINGGTTPPPPPPPPTDLYTYTITRDGMDIVIGHDVPYYDDFMAPPGEHTYCVKVVYDLCVSPEECVTVTVFEPIPECPPASNLTATVDGNNATLNWTAPEASQTPSAYTFTVIKDGVDVATGLTTTTYTETGLNSGTYNYCIKVVYEVCTSDNICTEVVIEEQLPCNPVTNLVVTAVDRDITLTWVAPATKNRTTLLEENFEGTSVPTGWTTIDADGDGNIWTIYGAPGVLGHGGVGNAISSASWFSGAVLTPDNYLVTPLVDGATQVKYWVNAQDAAYPADHYAVCASSTGTNAADFTIIFEETLTAKNSTNGKNPRGTTVQGTWYERTVDLPAGTKYIAWRHYNSSDNFYMNIDDVTVTGGGTPSSVSYNVYCNDVLLGNTTQTTYQDLNKPNSVYNYCVEAVHPHCTAVKVCKEISITVSYEDAISSNITLFPNPVSNILNIKGNDIKDIRIFNSNGKLISTFTNVNKVDVSNYSNGIYYIEISNSYGKTAIQKFVVKK